jgi:hypothetical protein
LLKHFMSFCCTPAKFKENFNVNLLLLHLKHFNEKKNCKATQKRHYKNV